MPNPTAERLIREAEAAGVQLRLTPEGSCKIAGDPEAIARWAPRLRQHRAEILDALRAGVGPHRRWLLRYADGAVDVLTCTPPATWAEITARYPHARAEPVPDLATEVAGW